MRSAQVQHQSFGARSLLGLIGFYQRQISPRKGFRCAHAVLHGGSGCSGFVREAIESHGAWSALSLARTRFLACKQAARVLQLQSGEESPFDSSSQADDEAPRDKRRGTNSGQNWDCCPDSGCLTADALFDGGLSHCGSGVCSAVDCGALDCAALDCGCAGCSCF